MSRTYRKTPPFYTQAKMDSEPEFYRNRLHKGLQSYDGSKIRGQGLNIHAIEGVITGWSDYSHSRVNRRLGNRKARMQQKRMTKELVRQMVIDEWHDQRDDFMEEWYDDTPMDYPYYREYEWEDDDWGNQEYLVFPTLSDYYHQM